MLLPRAEGKEPLQWFGYRKPHGVGSLTRPISHIPEVLIMIDL